MNAVDFLFWVFAVITVGGGICMIFSRHPISAAMFMIVSLIGVAALFVLLEAFFLAVLQVLVYAGAVMVLFLFIIMLLDVGPDAVRKKISNLKFGLVGFCTSILLISVLILSLVSNDFVSFQNSFDSALADDSFVQSDDRLLFSTKVSSFGYGLMTKYMLPIQISGFMLLASMIGVIILSKKSASTEDL
jgi:NADH-quinone oxidoreductase subunit J